MTIHKKTRMNILLLVMERTRQAERKDKDLTRPSKKLGPIKAGEIKNELEMKSVINRHLTDLCNEGFIEKIGENKERVYTMPKNWREKNFYKKVIEEFSDVLLLPPFKDFNISVKEANNFNFTILFFFMADKDNEGELIKGYQTLFYNTIKISPRENGKFFQSLAKATYHVSDKMTEMAYSGKMSGSTLENSITYYSLMSDIFLRKIFNAPRSSTKDKEIANLFYIVIFGKPIITK